MAGYYDETTGDWIDTGSTGVDPLTDASGTNTMHDAAIADPSGGYTDWQGYPVDSTGQPLPGNPSYVDPSSVGGPSADPVSSIGSFLTKLTGGNFTASDLANMVKNNSGALTGLAGLYTAMQGANANTSGTGYKGTIPSLSGIRSQIHYNDLNRAPGSSGRQYFTDMAYVAPGLAGATQTAADARAKQIADATPVAAAKSNPYEGKFATPWADRTMAPTQNAPASSVINQLPVPQAQGTQTMATGGLAHGRYLQGATDGMADKINTSIDGKQPAKLSHGEFVVPADVVSHLGNGNSDAGAQRLYSMMDKVRQARTGTKKQGKEINPDKFMPGGLASAKGYAAGGAVAFATGGTTAATPVGTSTSSTLSPWAGDYVTNMLGQGAAAAQAPYQAYTGQLTAGPSDLQQQQFAGLSQVAQTGLTPTNFSFNADTAKQYMNPYLQASLDPQLAELQRQAQIANVADASKLTGQGGFGGGRQAVLMGEQNRNLLDKSQQLIGQGYNTAYNNAANQFNTEAKNTQAANEASAQFGLNSLNALGAAGATQQGIEQAGLTADKAQFEEQRDYPLKMAQYQQGLLSNLPLQTNTNTANNTALGSLLNTTGGLSQLYSLLSNLGQTPTTPAQ
jgi:hypothetical protein